MIACVTEQHTSELSPSFMKSKVLYRVHNRTLLRLPDSVYVFGHITYVTFNNIQPAFSNGLIPSCFPTEILHAFLINQRRSKHHTPSDRFKFIAWKSWSFLFPYHSVSCSLLDPTISEHHIRKLTLLGLLRSWWERQQAHISVTIYQSARPYIPKDWNIRKHYFNTRTVYFYHFGLWPTKAKLQLIITLLHISTLSCHPQGARK